jgi:hypothetical protein
MVMKAAAPTTTKDGVAKKAAPTTTKDGVAKKAAAVAKKGELRMQRDIAADLQYKSSFANLDAAQQEIIRTQVRGARARAKPGYKKKQKEYDALRNAQPKNKQKRKERDALRDGHPACETRAEKRSGSVGACKRLKGSLARPEQRQRAG